MSTSKEDVKDGIRIGDQSAMQPLSGTSLVNSTSVKGFNGTTVLHIREAKKSA